MKTSRTIILLFFLTLFVSELQAQQRTPGQWVIKADGGVTLLNDLGKGSGGVFGIGFEKIFAATKHGLRFDINYKTQSYNIIVSNADYNIPANVIDAGVYYSYLCFATKFFSINANIGGFVGYEFRKNNYSDIYLHEKGCISTGVAIAPQFEFRISPMIGLFAEPNFRYNFISAERFTIQGKLGLKIYL